MYMFKAALKLLFLICIAFSFSSEAVEPSKYDKLSASDLLAASKKYQFMPQTKNGQPIWDKNGDVLMKSRVLRSYMRETCRDLQADDYEKYDIKEWKAIPLEFCQYRVYDRNAQDKIILTKGTSVILAKIDEDLLANWLANSCLDIGQPSMRCIEFLSHQIILQSRGQFPVRGIVYEDQFIQSKVEGKRDILGEDKVYEPYCFRDGLTVFVEAFNDKTTGILSKDQVEACYLGPLADVPRKIGRLARIQATSMDMYLANGGSVKDIRRVVNEEDLKKESRLKPGELVPTDNWLYVSRTEMINAVKTGNNKMLTAWARANLAKIQMADSPK